MGVLTKVFRFGARTKRPPRPEDVFRELIAANVGGRSFIDVGCMWKVNGDYAFHALAHGASRVVGFDRAPATPEFLARNAQLATPIEFVRGDVNDPDLESRVGHFDVVFCSGVLYHVPSPLLTLSRLRRICDRTLILATASTHERDEPQAAFYLPYLDAEGRERLNYPTRYGKVGLDTEFVAEKEYGNWFWLFTPSCVRAMLRTAGFEVLEFYERRRAVTAVCRPASTAALGPLLERA